LCAWLLLIFAGGNGENGSIIFIESLIEGDLTN